MDKIKYLQIYKNELPICSFYQDSEIYKAFSLTSENKIEITSNEFRRARDRIKEQLTIQEEELKRQNMIFLNCKLLEDMDEVATIIFNTQAKINKLRKAEAKIELLSQIYFECINLDDKLYYEII